MTFQNFLTYFLEFLIKTDRLIASMLCYLLQKIRPLFGPENVCPFAIGCTNFALFNLENQPVPLALCFIFKRVLMCNPIGIWIIQIRQKRA